jgi:hypothetical protein
MISVVLVDNESLLRAGFRMIIDAQVRAEGQFVSRRDFR